jgi:MFS family permease|tara:strand:+ start:15224 stop:16477 length:1254 start_codon:yes stop_codon:yes gene_type:complete
MIRTQHWPWLQLVVAFLIQATGAGALSYSYSVIAVPLAETFDASRMTLMLGLTCMTLGAGVVSPMAGIAIDRLSLRLIMIFAILMTSLGFVALSVTTAMWQVPAIYGLVFCFGYVLLGPLSASTLLARWFTRKRGLALGIAGAGTSFGGFLFPPLISWLTDLLGWRVALQVFAAVIALIAIPVALMAADRPALKGYTPPLPEGDADHEAHTGARFNSTDTIIRHRAFWVIAISVGFMFAAFTATVGSLTPFVLDTGATREQGAMLIANLALAAVPGTLLFGWCADRFDVRLALAAIMLLMMLGLALFWGTPDMPRLFAGSLILGLGGGGMLPVWSSLLAQIYGVLNYGRVMGLMSPVLLPFNLLTPPLAGWIRDVTGSYDMAFMAFVLLLLLAVVMIPLIERSGPGLRPVEGATVKG